MDTLLNYEQLRDYLQAQGIQMTWKAVIVLESHLFQVIVLGEASNASTSYPDDTKANGLINTDYLQIIDKQQTLSSLKSHLDRIVKVAVKYSMLTGKTVITKRVSQAICSELVSSADCLKTQDAVIETEHPNIASKDDLVAVQKFIEQLL